MDLPRVIGITGKKGAGKDTAGAYLVDRYGYERVSFAGPLKESAAALLGVRTNRLENLKNDPNARVEFLYTYDSPGVPQATELISRLTVREFLQRYGTEAHREVFGQDFWVEAIQTEIDERYGERFVVTDVRFENEAEMILGYDSGVVLRVTRPGSDEDDVHASEAKLPDDLVTATIVNAETIPEFQQSIDTYLQDRTLAAELPGQLSLLGV